MARLPGAYSTTSDAVMTRRVWQAMRMLRTFSVADLEVTAEAGKSVAERYVRALSAAGFLRLVRPRVSGRAGSRNVWQLVRDTGPLPPIRRKDRSGVFDQNTQEAYPR